MVCVGGMFLCRSIEEEKKRVITRGQDPKTLAVNLASTAILVTMIPGPLKKKNLANDTDEDTLQQALEVELVQLKDNEQLKVLGYWWGKIKKSDRLSLMGSQAVKVELLTFMPQTLAMDNIDGNGSIVLQSNTRKVLSTFIHIEKNTVTMEVEIKVELIK